MPNAALPPELAAVARTERRNGHRIAPPRMASVLGLGHYLPTEVRRNDRIAQRIGVDDEWIVKRTGIRSRHRAAPDERLTEILTRLTNYDDRKTAALWGDGAGAVVLGHDGEGAVGPVVLSATVAPRT